MAIMLGALIIHGIQPGPMLINEQPEMFWGLVVSFAIGNIMLVLLNIPTIGIWESLLRIPFSWPAKAGAGGRAAGKTELGAVAVSFR